MFDSLLVIVLAGLVGPLLAAGRRPLIPAVVGELLAGMALGRSGLGLIDASTPVNGLLYGLGFGMLMLVAGSRIDPRSPDLRAGARLGGLAFAMTAALAVPAGLIIGEVLARGAPVVLFPVLLAGSSAAVAFPILAERGLLGARVAPLLAWIAAADALTVLAMPLTLIGPERIPAALVGDAVIVGLVVAFLLIGERLDRWRPALLLRDRSRTRGWALQLRLALVILVVLSAIAVTTGGSTLVAGFGAGIVIAGLREPERLDVQLSGVAEGFFVPAFFVLLGSELDLRALASDPAGILLGVAMGGAAIAVHVVAARLSMDGRPRRSSVGERDRFGGTPARATGFGLAASAQLGLPAGAASLGLSTGLLTPAVAAGIMLGALLTVVPASFGTRRLADELEPEANPADWDDDVYEPDVKPFELDSSQMG